MKKTPFKKQELITLGMIFVLGVVACIVLLVVPPGSPHAKWLPRCMFHQMTGLYCPGCGATRALSAMLHGDIKSSLHNNALLIPLGATLFVLIAKPEISLKRPVAFAIVAIVLSFTVLRNIPVAPFTYLAPVPLPQTETPAPVNTPEPAEADGYLTSLLDADGNGLNLRSVCEAVHSERDLLCKEIFGNNYDTTKTQVAFIVYTGGRHTNLYRASYTATFRPEDGAEPVSIWFTVDVYDLYREGGRIRYGSIDVSMYDSEEESKRLPSSGSVTKLWGGGVRVNGKNGFDLNGFVRFPNSPTSYRLANGVYWSPTYDLLDEDMIWALTAVDGHSLANLLRYARKEIYARYYTAFDPKTEREFNEHYRAYAWYEPRTPDLSGLMTEAEKSNIRLLREIQSLIEK